MANSRKYQIRSAGVAADLVSQTNNYKLNRTTGAYETVTDENTITASDIVIIGKKSNISDRIDALEKNITVLAAASLLESNTDALAGSYTIANKLATARTIALGGDLSGSASFDGTSNVTITATVQPNSVVLGTDTTGNYMTDLTAGTGISITHTPGEGSTATIGVSSATALRADTHYIGTTSVALNRSSANLALTGISSVTFPGSTSGTVQLIPTAAVGTGTILTIPATTGTIVTTGDSGTVTNTMLAGSIANAKLTNSAITVNSASTSLGGSVTLYAGTTTLQTSSANQALTGITSVTLPGSTSGTVQLIPTAAVGTGTVLTIPATTGTIVTTGDSGTVTNTMLAGSIANAKLTNSSVTVGTTSISLGASSTTLAGLTSVTSTSFTGALTGNASTATTLATARTINGVSFDGSANVTVHTAGTGISVSGTTVSIDSTVATLTGSQTLTNKTLTSPVIGSAGAVFNGSTSGTAVLSAPAVAGTATAIVLPSTAGTLVGTGDTGSVTNAMLAGSIANTKLVNSSVTVTAGTGLSGGGAVALGSSVTLTNAGVTSNVAGTGISVSGATGAVTITNTGVTSIAGTANQITASASTGGVTLSLPSSVTLPGDLTVTGNLTINGSTITANSANAAYTDALIELHYINGGTLTSNDGKDVGLRMHYYTTVDKNAALVLSNSTRYLDWIVDGTETTGTFSGTYGTYRGLSYISTATTGTAPFTVSSTTRVANLNVATAGTADTLTTARTINGVSFDGSANVTVTTAGTGISVSGTTVTNTGIITASAGTGISVSGTNPLTITNTGVTSLVAGTNIAVSGSTGAVTVSVTGTVADSSALNGISAVNLFNNMGNTHGTRTSFDASTPSYGHGFRYVQGSTNGPGTSGTQFYSWYLGLGADYPATGAGSYGAMFAVDRNVTNPYLSVRYNEGNSFTSWYKIRAGAADILTTARTINGVSFDGSANVTVTTAGTGISVSGTTVTNTGIISASAGTGISVSGTNPLSITNTGIISASAGTGISVSGTNPLTITNTGVTSLVAGTNISLSGSTGAVTVNVSGTVASATAVPSVDRDRTLASTLPTTFSQSVRFDFVNATAIGTNGNYGGVMTFAPYTGTSASTGDASYQLAFGSTATNGSGTPRMRIRNGIDSTWNSFYEIPNSANIGSYAVTTLATSGSGISVNASQGAVTITSNATTSSTASTIVLRDTNGYIQNNYFYTSGGGSERNASGMSYFAGFNSSDYYIRSYTPAAVATAISGQTMNINGSSTSCSGNAATATTATNTSGGTVNGNYLGVQNTTGSTGYGVSLYNGAVAGQPQYGLFFGTTANWGTHGSVTADWATYFTMDSTANRGWVFRNTVSGNVASINNSGTATFNGEVTAYSDARLKTNVVTIDKALDKVVKLRGVYFDKDSKRQIGVIAQEIREVFPEVVNEANDEQKTLSVNYGAIAGALIESTKDLNSKIEAQAQEIAELKALVQQLLSNK